MRAYDEALRSASRTQESVATFVTTKVALFERLAPGIPERVKMRIVTELMRSDVCAYARLGRFEDMDDLLQTLKGVERDLKCLPQGTVAKQQPRHGREAQSTNQDNQRETPRP